ncbi:flippase-like domain-containing protein [Rhodanobacter sp. 7MK24]|uniref:lysylphosphatidylglycerol synthase transmembrane domain-containing protein n=1 Tax=Rhodanobacter sp. 7MK24 TaxID=2775922 RepID=UPI00177D157B|nr:lysylphosphatidylglycerol synthase transmembrane domain-containing protein [Rhodanobacter sp. 7MK24]MBD8881291.1 flippase-like domain-containing protein [Rhodanobacter sp. 7MK24]
MRALIRRRWRHLLVLLIAAICIVATIRLFDWHMVARALGRLRLGLLLAGAVPLLLAIFSVRGLRWLFVLGVEPDRRRFWHSLCANGAASGLASLTPFQLGEVIKIRLIPDHHAGAWRLGVSAFFVERVLDFGGVVGMGLSGGAWHFGFAWLAPLALFLPLLAGLLLSILAVYLHHLPQRLQPYVEVLRHRERIVRASLLTVIIWLLYAGLWWLAVAAINVHIDFSEVCLLLGGVMLAVVASMTPAGLGVSELGSRGIMLWLGASASDAEAVAIALRLLTPLIALAGFICLLFLLRSPHSEQK